MKPKRIAVVGAGLAGLAAAMRLEETGHQVTVFEARDRVGGRVWTERIEHEDGSSTPIERGAEFIIEGYDQFSSLTERLDLQLVDTGMSYYKREPIDVAGVTLESLSAAGQHLAAKLTEADRNKPIEALLTESGLPSEVQEVLRARIEISTALPIEAVSGDALVHAASFSDAPSWRIQGGNQQLPTAMKESLNTDIYFNEKITSVDSSGEGVTLRTSSGTYLFDACIVAIPLGVVRNTKILKAELSNTQKALLDQVKQGHAAKLQAGLVARPQESATMSVRDRYWSWTARETRSQVGRVLNGFMGSAPAIEHLLSNEDPKTAWLEKARAARPDLVFDQHVSAVFTNWKDDPYALGAYSGRPPGLEPDDLAPLIRVSDSVVLAGEYLGGEKIGLMEGAICSGYRAARELTKCSTSQRGATDV